MKPRQNLHWLVGGSLLLLVTVFSSIATDVLTNAPAVRPPNWAQPLTVAGIDNCYQVSPELFRGAQPTALGMENLKKRGIKTVINLRAHHSDKDKVAGTGLKSVRFEMNPWHVDQGEVVSFLKVMADTNNLPVFVHCQRGADRTGLMCAMYRVTVCNWSKQEAIAEMTKGGFHFAPAWRDIVEFIENADIAKIKQRAGLPTK